MQLLNLFVKSEASVILYLPVLYSTSIRFIIALKAIKGPSFTTTLRLGH